MRIEPERVWDDPQTKKHFSGWAPRECGEHRTVGPHRAWCHGCGEWCYSSEHDMACIGCRLLLMEEKIARFDSGEYPVRYQQGHLSIENLVDISTSSNLHDCQVGIQVSDDGRIWLCVDGTALIRFKPARKTDAS